MSLGNRNFTRHVHDFTITIYNQTINKQMMIRSLFKYVKTSMKFHPSLTKS